VIAVIYTLPLYGLFIQIFIYSLWLNEVCDTVVCHGLAKMWYRDLFEGRWAEFWLEEFSEYKEMTKYDVSFLKETLRRGITLDLCCGLGRHSIPLSHFTFIVSFDLSKYFLTILIENGKKEGYYKNLNPIRGDMRRLPSKSESFDNVISFYTSFGYFNDEENELVLREGSRILKSNGIFILEIVNAGWIIRNFRDRSWNETDSFYVLEERSLDWTEKKIKSNWVLIDKGEGKVCETMVEHRIYDLNELKSLLSKVGLRLINVFGSSQKEGFNEARSSRMLIVGQKAIYKRKKHLTSIN